MHRLHAWVVAALRQHADSTAAWTRQEKVVLGVIACFAMALRVRFAISTGLTEGGALMTLRYSENIAAGNGFVYNAGERILGTTTPLFTLLVAAGIKLGLPSIGFAKALDVVSDGALCVVVAAWLRASGLGRASLIAAFMVAVDPHLSHWAFSGSETSLVTLFIASAWFAYASRREALTYGFLGILFLLRWDTVVMAGVITAAIVLRERRLPLRGLVVFAATIAPWVIFGTWYFGNPIPITFAAKSVVFGHVPQPSRLQHLWEVLGLLVSTRSDIAIAAAALAGLFFVAVGRRVVLWPVVVWYAAYWSAYAVSKIQATGKYATPTLPAHLVLASIGVAVLGGWALSRWPRSVRYTLAGVAMIVTLVPLRSMERSAQAHERFEQPRVPVGLWLKEHSAPTDRVMVTYGSSVGTFGYYAERPVIDSKGTVTPITLPFWKHDSISPDFDIARALRPEWCVMRVGELPQIERGAHAAGVSWGDDYELAATFPLDRTDSIQVYRRRRGGEAGSLP